MQMESNQRDANLTRELSDGCIGIVTDDHFVGTSGVLSVDQVINTGDLCYGVAATPGPSS